MSHTPLFAGPIEGWTVNYCKVNFWRVQSSMMWDDVMQEANVVFLRCQAKYPDIETPQHFMALYKTAWTHHFTDLAFGDSKLKVMVSTTLAESDTDGVEFEATGDLYNDGHLATLLRQAPSEVLMVLNLFLSAPTEIIEVALSGWQGRDRRCKTGGSKRICQMLGLSQDLDVMKMVEDYFQPN